MTPRPQSHPARITLLCLALTLAAPLGHALTSTQEVGPLTWSVYAPDWTWQGKTANILVVVDNPTDDEVTADVHLTLPEGKEGDFEFKGDATVSLTIPPGESVRGAFTNIVAKGGVPLQTYAFTLSASCGGVSSTVDYPLKTIRGQAFSGSWVVALFVPAGFALAWCIAFAVALRGFDGAGAWKRVPEPVGEPENLEAWIND